MNYELAKKLKDAGWVQNTDNVDQFIYDDDYTEESGCYLPTLSELIEACDPHWADFELVNNLDSHGKWQCTRGDKHGEGIGETPEEAVANLWFVLNKKK
mgnify:CR=1 FL=1